MTTALVCLEPFNGQKTSSSVTFHFINIGHYSGDGCRNASIDVWTFPLRLLPFHWNVLIANWLGLFKGCDDATRFLQLFRIQLQTDPRSFSRSVEMICCLQKTHRNCCCMRKVSIFFKCRWKVGIARCNSFLPEILFSHVVQCLWMCCDVRCTVIPGLRARC